MHTVTTDTATMPILEGTDAEIDRVGDYLRQHFTERAVLERLSIPSVYEFRSIREGREVPAGDVPRDTTDVLLRLFMDAEPVARSVVDALIAPDVRHVMESLGLLGESAAAGGDYEPRVLLYPSEGLHLISDVMHVLRPDAVYPAVTHNTRTFLASLPTTPCEAALELCAGTGVAALIASRAARHAWATDITERSVRFALFNARLNRITNVSVEQGDLYGAVPGLTFDRIVAHPPYMPEAEQRFVFRDGGEDGEQITRRIIAGLPEVLRPGGQFYGTCMMSDREGAPVEDRVRAMLGDHAPEFDVFVAAMRSFHPTEYYCKLAALGRITFAEAGVRHEFFQKIGAERLVYSSFQIERHEGARTPITVRRQRNEPAAAADNARALRWERFAEAGRAPAILALRPALSARTRFHLVQRLDGASLMTEHCTIRVEAPFHFSLDASQEAMAFLGRCDGRVTVAEHLGILRAAGAVPDTVADADFSAMVRSLIGGGVLDVEEADVPS